MKSLIFAGILSSALFFGCSSKDVQPIDAQNEQAVISTQKTRVALEDGSTLLFTATYLNNMKKYSLNEEELIVFSFYYSPSNENSPKIGDPKVSLNGKEAQILELEKDDETIQYLPSQNAWSRYFFLSAPKSKSDTLTLTCEIYPFEKAVLRLQKEL